MQLGMSSWFRLPPLWSGHKAPAIAVRYFWFFVYKHIMLSIITIFAFRAVKASLFICLFELKFHNSIQPKLIMESSDLGKILKFIAKDNIPFKTV